ncbi:MAG TPA: YggS family pyridoxal phosphate-dependent enzyme [Sphingobacteriaceae bacterium]|nr:YggS family pyridoxal phosphate-dependent enzyme [Sphingobacteriaceae bacterium]
MSIAKNIQKIREEIAAKNVTLVAVSKTRTIEEVMESYATGQRIFGENLVQELMEKQPLLPGDIQWHLLGHLQRNKVKYIAQFIALIHSVDSLRLLVEINKQAKKHDRVIDCLLQVFIASEDTKFGLDHVELIELLSSEEFAELQNIRIRGLMGMATNTSNEKQVKEEFYELKTLFDGVRQSYFRKNPAFDTLSMGMSSDYRIAIEQGSTMIRLGTTLYGKRVIKHYTVKE